MRKSYRFIALFLTLACVLAAGAVASAEVDKTGWPDQLRFMAGPPGGNWFALGTALAEMWTGAGLPAARDIAACLMPLLYAAIFSSGIAYTLQIVAQSRLEPSVASLIMSLESVFAVISGSLFLGERMTQRELAGCALVFAAVILAQLPPGKVDYER